MYYPDEVYKKLGVYGDNKTVRMITVAPEYPDFLLTPITKLGYVESYTYTIKAFNNTIEDICVEKLKMEHKDAMTNAQSDVNSINVAVDDIIDSFIYTRKALCEKMKVDKNDERLDSIALEIVKISRQNEK
jgi:hypothetical protein